MGATRAASVAGFVVTLSVVAWSVDSRGQPLQVSVRPEPIAQAPATTPGAAPPVAAPRPAAPALKVWPLTALSTERRLPAPKSGLTAGAGNRNAEQRSGSVGRSAGAPPRTTPSGPAGRSRPAAAGLRGTAGPRRARGAGQEPPVEFDATLETILYWPNRRLAIVDGRIVEVGDEIRGARIVDITPGAVLFLDSGGATRTLSLAAGR